MFEVLLVGHFVTAFGSYFKIHEMLCDICHRIEREFPEKEILERVLNRKSVKQQEKIIETFLLVSTLVPGLNVVFTYGYLQKKDRFYEAIKEEIAKVYSEELEIRRLRGNKYSFTNNVELEVPTNEKVEVVKQYYDGSVSPMSKEEFYSFPEETQTVSPFVDQNNNGCQELGPRKVLRPRNFNKYN